MARKKRKKEEEVDFEMPEFDEADYLRREVEGAKAALVTVGYAFLVALASYGLTLVGLAALGGVLGLLSLYGLKYLYPVARIDLATFDKKIWAGNAAVLIFTWLAFWILIMNPPISDLSPPVIERVQVLVPGMAPTNVTSGETLSVPPGTTVTVRATVEDNVQVAEVRISMGDNTAVMTHQEGDRWTHSFDSGSTVHDVRIVGVDHGGRESDVFRFTLSAAG